MKQYTNVSSRCLCSRRPVSQDRPMGCGAGPVGLFSLHYGLCRSCRYLLRAPTYQMSTP